MCSTKITKRLLCTCANICHPLLFSPRNTSLQISSAHTRAKQAPLQAQSKTPPYSPASTSPSVPPYSPASTSPSVPPYTPASMSPSVLFSSLHPVRQHQTVAQILLRQQPALLRLLHSTQLQQRRGCKSRTSGGTARAAGVNGSEMGKLRDPAEQLGSPVETRLERLAFAEGYALRGEQNSTVLFVAVGGVVVSSVALVALCCGVVIYEILNQRKKQIHSLNLPREEYRTDRDKNLDIGQELVASNELIAEKTTLTFKDVGGAKEAKQELQDIVAYLRDPGRISHLGGTLPKGVLLAGPPGTGKTLLARAVAGEADVPFFHAGSQYNEIFGEQGAKRIRDVFRSAKARAPCVLFIDEIDSVGGRRSSTIHHPHANQTINQLLTEIDGFHSNEGVIVLGATNRREYMDAALVRTGRFDVKVTVNLPDLIDRKEIFRIYLRKIKAESDIDIEHLARSTVGFTGADIEALVNQAALRAAILKANTVGITHLEWAREKILMGVERKSRLPDQLTNRTTAFHEAGHTVVAYFTKHAHPVHRVTIAPRGGALGYTWQLAEREQPQRTYAQLVARIDVLLAGRVAEELALGRDCVSSGAGDDLQRATALAGRMVRQWGMSERLGLRSAAGAVSGDTLRRVDAEVERLLREAQQRVRALLQTRHREMQLVAEALLQHETLDAAHVEQIVRSVAGEKPQEPSDPVEPTCTGDTADQTDAAPDAPQRRTDIEADNYSTNMSH